MKIDAVNFEIVKSYLLSFSLDDVGTDVDLALRLDKFFKDRLSSGVEMAYCETCQCYSFADLEECPFCGDCEELGEHPEPEEVKPAPVARNPITDVVDGITDLRDGIEEKEVYNERDLDSLLKEIQRSLKIAVVNAHRAGRLLAHVRLNKIWRLRRRRDGKPLYGNFFQAITKEIDLAKTHAYKLISFGQTAEIDKGAKYGYQRMINASPIIYSGTTRRVIEHYDFVSKRACIQVIEKYIEDDDKETFRIKDEHGNLEDIKISKDHIRHRPPKKKRPIRLSTKKRLVELMLGSTRIPLYKRPTGHTSKTAKSAKTDPAVSIREDPWGMLRLNKEVVLFFYVTMAMDGTLSASIEIALHPERLDDVG